MSEKDDLHLLGHASGKRDALAMIEADGLEVTVNHYRSMCKIICRHKGPPVSSLFRGYVEGLGAGLLERDIQGMKVVKGVVAAGFIRIPACGEWLESLGVSCDQPRGHTGDHSGTIESDEDEPNVG